jgi:hypothetical protein
MLLWSWDIKIGQGDIYVYPTINSPFNSNRTWKAILMVCFMLTPFILLAAAIGIGFILWQREMGIDVAMITLVMMVTAVYGVLQSEPRYSVPFRNVEIILAGMGLASLLALRPRKTTR